MRHPLLLTAVAAACLSVMAVAKETTEEALPKPAQKLVNAMRAANVGQCGKAVRLARPLTADTGGLSGMGISFALATIAQCEFNTGDKAGAAVTIRRATAIDDASDEVWHDRLRLDILTQDWRAAVETVEAMTQGRGEALNKVDMSWLWQLHRTLKDKDLTALRERLLRVLTQPSYTPSEPLGHADGFRLAYAEMLVGADKKDEAATLVRDISTPPQLALISLDPRLRALLPAEPDVRAAWEAWLREGQRAAALHPDLLDPVLEVSNTLRTLGRPADALKVLQTVMPLIDTPGAFRDLDERLPWLYDAFGRAYAALGRDEEAMAAFRAGAALKEAGNLNVSQVINLAHAQVSAGKGDDALKTLALFDDPSRKGSPYGESEMRLARVCARAVAGRPADAATDIAYLRDHEKDHPEALTDALLCIKDMDGAAGAMIRRLEDPERQADALQQLSDYDPPANGRRGPIDLGVQEIKLRPDVKAAAERAGGVRRFKIQSSDL